ncbi:hypothetical protein ACROSR_20265 [Roseovarius tibetensis]|uniref:hypothetical protein n=1 Tax=Roseovarius tibetensis TaxID=2685897 RepID=UPI003D7F840F
MGKGGYNGGSTILKFFAPSYRKKKKKNSVPEDYDFEQRAEAIRRELKNRKDKLAKGQSLVGFTKLGSDTKKKSKKAKSKKLKKIKE